MSRSATSWLSDKRLLLRLFALLALALALGIAARWMMFESITVEQLRSSFRVEGVAVDEQLQATVLDIAYEAMIWSHAISVLTGLAVAGLLVVLVLRPLNKVIDVTRRVGNGDFEARVPASWDDELGELGRSFNAMTANLQRIESLRRKMVVDVAHDLRAPLTNIRGTLEAFGAGIAPLTRERLASLNEEVGRLSNLIESMLRLSIADAAASTMARERGDLTPLVEQSLNLFAYLFAQKNIRMFYEPDSLEQIVSADFEQLAQVLQNLLDNALRHTPEGGSVRVEVRESGDVFTVTVANTGAAIDAVHWPHLFDRFYRVDASRSKETGGVGIGLAIVKDLVEAHGGEVGVESTGSENRFWFTVPSAV